MKFVVTAGPTQEPIDPVRYIGNRSSGKMGYAIATAAAEAGHETVLVSGPVAVDPPAGLEALVKVATAEEMYAAVVHALAGADVLIMCAAVADYRPVRAAEKKIKKSAESLTLELVKNRDILLSIHEDGAFGGVNVGFAAETDNLAENAADKMRRKGCDLLVANDVSRGDIGFGTDENEVTLFFPDGRREPLPRASKSEIGRKLIEVCEQIFREKNA